MNFKKFTFIKMLRRILESIGNVHLVCFDIEMLNINVIDTSDKANLNIVFLQQ